MALGAAPGARRVPGGGDVIFCLCPGEGAAGALGLLPGSALKMSSWGAWAARSLKHPASA